MALVIEERDGAVLTLTLNRPETRNTITDPAMIAAVTDALSAADADISVHVVILAGAGGAFSSGGDVRKMGAGDGLRGDQPVETRRNYRTGIQRLPLLFQSLEVPIVAAIDGPAIGAGCDLACMCDIRVASDRAVFAESFVKLGLVAGDGGAWLLPRIVGWPKATEMALTGAAIDAAEALRCGLVSRVVTADALLPAAREVADAIAANPPHATRMTKRLLRQAQETGLAAALDMAAAMQALAHETPEHGAAIAAFAARRRA